MKPLETTYIVFLLKFIYEVNNNLFPMVACSVKTQSSEDPTMNAELIIIIIIIRIFQQDKSFNKNIAGFNACPA